jgi:hypothetical protein
VCLTLKMHLQGRSSQQRDEVEQSLRGGTLPPLSKEYSKTVMKSSLGVDEV